MRLVPVAADTGSVLLGEIAHFFSAASFSAVTFVTALQQLAHLADNALGRRHDDAHQQKAEQRR